MIEPSTPTADCPEPQLWSALDDQSCEIDVLTLLTALVMAFKPKVIVETGTCYGHSAQALAMGVLYNGFGSIVTCDPVRKFRDLPVVVTYFEKRGTDLKIDQPIDLLFLDSDPDTRVDEYYHFKPLLSSRALVVIHDTGETHAQLLREVRSLVSGGELEGVFLPTPRGLFIGRRA